MFLVGHDAHRRTVVLAGRVAGGDGGFGVELGADRPQRGDLLEGDVGTRMLVAVDDHVGLATLAGDGDRHQFVVESARLMCGDGALVRPDRQFVLFLARDSIFAAQVLCGFDHPAVDGMACAACGFAGAVEAVEKIDPALAHAGAQTQRVVLDIGHRLCPAGHDDSGGAGGDLAGRVEHRLQARPTAAVDLQTRHPGTQTRIEAAIRPMAGASPLA